MHQNTSFPSAKIINLLGMGTASLSLDPSPLGKRKPSPQTFRLWPLDTYTLAFQNVDAPYVFKRDNNCVDKQ